MRKFYGQSSSITVSLHDKIVPPSSRSLVQLVYGVYFVHATLKELSFKMCNHNYNVGLSAHTDLKLKSKK